MRDNEEYWYPITEHSADSVPQIEAFSPNVNATVQAQCSELLSSLIHDEIGTEGTVSIRLRDLSAEYAKGESGEGGVRPIHLNEPYIAIHNHPSNSTFSTADLRILSIDANCHAIVVVGNNGENVFILKKTDSFDVDGFTEYLRDYVEGHSKYDSMAAFLKGSERYGTEYHD